VWMSIMLFYNKMYNYDFLLLVHGITKSFKIPGVIVHKMNI